jgi:hypothetical protein
LLFSLHRLQKCHYLSPQLHQRFTRLSISLLLDEDMTSHNSISSEARAKDSGKTFSDGDASLVETNSSAAAVPDIMTREQSNPIEGDTRSSMPPSTPVSSRTTLSSRTSTAKSRSGRKFNQKWLATPSSNGAGSPLSKKPASPHSSPTLPPPAMSLTPSTPADPDTNSPNLPTRTLGSSRSRDLRRIEPNEMAAGLQYTHPAVPPNAGYYSQPYGGGIPPPLGPRYGGYGPSYNAQGYADPASYYGTTYQPSFSFPGLPSPNTSPPYNTSPAYGGEARHHVPIGVNPSPPVQINRDGVIVAHAIAPTEPNIPEHPSAPTSSMVEPKSQTSSVKPGKKGKTHWYQRSR